MGFEQNPYIHHSTKTSLLAILNKHPVYTQQLVALLLNLSPGEKPVCQEYSNSENVDLISDTNNNDDLINDSNDKDDSNDNDDLISNTNDNECNVLGENNVSDGDKCAVPSEEISQ